MCVFILSQIVNYRFTKAIPFNTHCVSMPTNIDHHFEKNKKMKEKNSFQLHFIIKQIHYITIFRDIELKKCK